MQVDFKEDLEVIIKNKICTVQLFFTSLPYSSKVFVKAVLGLNFECFTNGLASAFEYYGGIPERVRQDNLNPCVNTALKGRSRKYTEKYIKFIEYYGYEISACNVARGNKKGNVERDIQTYTHKIRSRLKIEGKQFENINDLNIRSLLIKERRPTINIVQEKIIPNLIEYDKLLSEEINYAYAH